MCFTLGRWLESFRMGQVTPLDGSGGPHLSWPPTVELGFVESDNVWLGWCLPPAKGTPNVCCWRDSDRQARRLTEIGALRAGSDAIGSGDAKEGREVLLFAPS